VPHTVVLLPHTVQNRIFDSNPPPPGGLGAELSRLRCSDLLLAKLCSGPLCLALAMCDSFAIDLFLNPSLNVPVGEHRVVLEAFVSLLLLLLLFLECLQTNFLLLLLILSLYCFLCGQTAVSVGGADSNSGHTS
jgi:hypothetical protein